MHSIVLAMALQMFFPVFENPAQSFASLALTNTSATDGEFTIRLNSPTGEQTGQVRVPIQSGHQRTVTVDQLRSGWISVESTTDNFTGYLAAGTGEWLAALEPASGLALTTYLPHIRVRTGFAETNHTDTSIAIVNPSAAAASVTLKLMSYDKSQSAIVEVEIPARSSKQFRASTLLAPGFATFNGRATVRSFTPIAVWEQIETPLAWSALRGRSEGDLGLGTVMTAPYFVFGGDLQSELTLYNPTEPAITLEAAAYDKTGQLLGERTRITLEPGKAFSEAVESLLRIPVIATVPGPVITGSVKLREVDNRPFRVFANMETRSVDPARRASMLYWLESATSHVWEIPYVARSEQYFTGYSVLAASESASSTTNVSIEVVDLNGVVVQRIERALAPRSLEAALIAPAAPGAYMRIWANQPIVALGTIGTHDGRLFEAIMPVR